MTDTPGRLVLLRHGESVANAHDFFGGWLDFPLTERGLAQSRSAADHMTRLGLVPDRVHTSVLGRAVDTAHELLDALNADALVRRHWRLNERHYGELQGLGKDEARARYGVLEVERWRRSPDAVPPPACAGLMSGQLDDRRYADPGARSIRSESLRQVVERIRPYWQQEVRPQIDVGDVVLVVSHGNVIRSLVHLVTGEPLERTVTHEVPPAIPLLVDGGRGAELFSPPARVH